MHPGKRPPPGFEAIPYERVGEHHCRCPTCGHLVDERDIDELLQHLEPGHQAPARH